MGWNMGIRQIHRWLGVAIAVGFLVNIVASLLKKETVLLGLLVLIPLIPLLITGLYLFVLPYVAGGPQRSAVSSASGGETRKAVT